MNSLRAKCLGKKLKKDLGMQFFVFVLLYSCRATFEATLLGKLSNFLL